MKSSNKGYKEIAVAFNSVLSFDNEQDQLELEAKIIMAKFLDRIQEIADQKVSSHFLVTRTGQLIQFVSTQQKAWHAGASSFLGREKCNDFSIGVELEGDGETPFEDVQYQVLARLVSELTKFYPQLQFAGHSDIAPERKTDPGKSFDWKKFQKATGLPIEKLPFGLHSR